MAKKTTGRKTTKKKTTARKTPAKKAAAPKKTTARKSPTKKKAPTKKTTVKKSTSKKKTTSKKAPAKKTTSKKTTSKKTTSKKKAPTKKTTSKKTTTSKKAPAKKTTSKKAPAKKTTAKKTTSKKTTTKKTAAKAATSKKTTTKKAPAKKKTTKKKTTSRRSGRSVAEVASAADADAQGFVFINGRRVRMISTSTKVAPKRTRAEKVVEEAAAPDSAKPKPIKTNLSRKQLDHYKALLLIKRAELAGDLTSLEAEALRSEGGNLSHMPIHMADIGSDTYEQDFKLGLAETERARMREIDEALRRIADKTYGICQMTGEPIPEARLEAKPWAKYTIEAARQLEQGWAG